MKEERLFRAISVEERLPEKREFAQSIITITDDGTLWRDRFDEQGKLPDDAKFWLEELPNSGWTRFDPNDEKTWPKEDGLHFIRTTDTDEIVVDVWRAGHDWDVYHSMFVRAYLRVTPPIPDCPEDLLKEK